MKNAAVAGHVTEREQAIAGLKAACNILERWGCTSEESQRILGLGRAAYYKNRKEPEKARLTGDQLTRISYILNIYSALRIVFNNPENVDGFMSMPNSNGYFNDRTPLSVIATGDFGALYETFRHVDGLRGGLW